MFGSHLQEGLILACLLVFTAGGWTRTDERPLVECSSGIIAVLNN